MTDHTKQNVYWTERHELALQSAYQRMLALNIPCERDGKANRSVIILYALQQLSDRPSK